MSARLVVGYDGNISVQSLPLENDRRNQPPETGGRPSRYFWFALPKTLRIFGEYRSSYPNGRFADYARASIVVAPVATFVTALCAGIIPLTS